MMHTMSEAFTIIGMVCTNEGLIQHGDVTGAVATVDWLPSDAFLCEQVRAPIYFDHDPTWELGRVVAYERGEKLGGLIAVAEITAYVRDYWTSTSGFSATRSWQRGWAARVASHAARSTNCRS